MTALAPFQHAQPELKSVTSYALKVPRALSPDDFLDRDDPKNRFSQVPCWLEAVPVREITASAKLVYAKISGWVKNGANPTEVTLAKQLGLDPRQVKRCVALLVKKGLLEVVDNRRFSRPNTYILMDNKLRSQEEDQGVPRGHESTEQMTPWGHPRPLPLGTSASPLYRYSDHINQIHTPSEYGGDPPRPSVSAAPYPWALPGSAGPLPGDQIRFKESSAINAPRHKTQRSEGSMNDRFSKAKSSFDRVEGEATNKVGQDVANKAKRRSARLDRQGAAGQRHPSIVALEAKWRGEMKDRLPDVETMRWGKRELGLAGDLLKRSDYDAMATAIEFAVSNWDRLFPHLVGPKRDVEEPSLDFFHRFASRILVISQLWAKHRSTWRQVGEWRRKASKFDFMPTELVDLQGKANEDLAKVGFKL